MLFSIFLSHGITPNDQTPSSDESRPPVGVGPSLGDKGGNPSVQPLFFQYFRQFQEMASFLRQNCSQAIQ